MEILVVEDHLPTAQSIAWLLRSNYQVTHAASCQQAEQYLQRKKFAALIVDLHLPDGSGLQFCQSGEESGASKVLVLSGESDVSTKVTTLLAGADDYLTKPFALLELQTRLQVLLRRDSHRQKKVQHIGPFTFCSSAAVVYHGNKNIRLTPREHLLLCSLLRHQNQVVSKEKLLEDIYDFSDMASVNTLEAHLKNLRRKLALPSKNTLIETIYGLGYRLNTTHA